MLAALAGISNQDRENRNPAKHAPKTGRTGLLLTPPAGPLLRPGTRKAHLSATLDGDAR
jgi:hypothetical protein